MMELHLFWLLSSFWNGSLVCWYNFFCSWLLERSVSVICVLPIPFSLFVWRTQDLRFEIWKLLHFSIGLKWGHIISFWFLVNTCSLNKIRISNAKMDTNIIIFGLSRMNQAQEAACVVCKDLIKIHWNSRQTNIIVSNYHFYAFNMFDYLNHWILEAFGSQAEALIITNIG